MIFVIKFLKVNKIDFFIYEYEYDVNVKSFGFEVVEKLNLCVEEVFKILLVIDEKNYFVVIFFVYYQLNLKKVVQVVGVKKLKMFDFKDVE